MFASLRWPSTVFSSKWVPSVSIQVWVSWGAPSGSTVAMKQGLGARSSATSGSGRASGLLMSTSLRAVDRRRAASEPSAAQYRGAPGVPRERVAHAVLERPLRAPAEETLRAAGLGVGAHDVPRAARPLVTLRSPATLQNASTSSHTV